MNTPSRSTRRAVSPTVLLANALVLAAIPACDTASNPAPRFSLTTHADVPPPPLSGGTLLVTRDGATAVASDPDRDVVWLVPLADHAAPRSIPLHPHDEPGRAVQDHAGRVHVVLRRGGAVITLDPAAPSVGAAILARREVCAAPRGIAYDPAADVLHVACATGELVTLPVAPDGVPTRRLWIERDLRDVVIDNGQLWVSTFRSATVRPIGPDGTAGAPVSLPEFAQDRVVPTRRSFTTVTNHFAPQVAWRMVALPGGGLGVVHQREQTTSVRVVTDSYYGTGPTCAECSCSVVHSTVTLLRNGRPVATPPMIPTATLPVDLAVSPDGANVALIAAANSTIDSLPQLYVMPTAQFAASGRCTSGSRPTTAQPAAGQAVAVAYDGAGALVVQTREPAAIFLPAEQRTITLDRTARLDTGHEIFHTNSGSFIACASCHPEGGDDGHIWQFDPGRMVRTQTLRGGILSTAPFHWDGSDATLSDLMSDVFVGRMTGPALANDQIGALERWIDALPAPATAPSPTLVRDPTEAIARGRALFNDPSTACATCHTGPKLTDNRTVDVGTGGGFQVPALVGLAARAPFMHTGCAATVRDRLTNTACGGGERHGHTSQLSASQLDDLAAYLESL